jgi:hypothetical protein
LPPKNLSIIINFIGSGMSSMNFGEKEREREREKLYMKRIIRRY